MTSYKGKPIEVTADGFGRYYARVDLPDTGYGNAGALSLDRHWDSIRAAARRAIRSYLGEAVDKSYQIRLEVFANQFDSLNIARSFTFREKD